MDEPEPLVLLSGMNCSDALWAELSLPRQVPVIMATPARATLDACLAELLERLPARFALCGLSLGGIVAMAMTRVAPERVTRLGLIATNARRPTAEQLIGWRRSIATLQGGASARDVQTDLLPLLLSDEARPRLGETVLAMADATGESLLMDQLRLQGTRIDERAGLARVAVPTMILGGDRDVLCPPDRHDEIAAAVGASSWVSIPGAGHLVPLERPREVSRALAHWLARD